MLTIYVQNFKLLHEFVIESLWSSAEGRPVKYYKLIGHSLVDPLPRSLISNQDSLSLSRSLSLIDSAHFQSIKLSKLTVDVGAGAGHGVVGVGGRQEGAAKEKKREGNDY